MLELAIDSIKTDPNGPFGQRSAEVLALIESEEFSGYPMDPNLFYDKDFSSLDCE